MQSTNPVASSNIIELKQPMNVASNIFDQAGFETIIERRHANRLSLLKWIKTNLVEGTDFGIIPTKKGAGKNTMFKSGAEKICVLLGLVQTFPAFHDYEQAALTNQKLELIILRCELLNEQGVIVATGIGARALKDDFGNVNKSLKMAAKSAAILATLSVAGLSEVFTVDMLEEPEVITVVSSEQLAVLNSLVTERSVPTDRLLAWLNKVAESKKLPAVTALADIPTSLFDATVSKIQSIQSN
jgi:hypothetical protein